MVHLLLIQQKFFTKEDDEQFIDEMVMRKSESCGMDNSVT